MEVCVGLFSGLLGWGKNEATKIVGVDAIVENKIWISKMSGKVFSKSRSDRIESFEEVIARRGLSEEDLVSFYFHHKIIFYMSLTFMLMTLFLIIVFVFSGNYFGVATGLGVWCILAAQLFRTSFRAYQIKVRKMASIKEWWGDGDYWFPTNSQKKKLNLMK